MGCIRPLKYTLMLNSDSTFWCNHTVCHLQCNSRDIMKFWVCQQSGLSLRAITFNTCYDLVSFIFPWCCEWNPWLLIEFNHKVTSLLQVWRTRAQVSQNLMTALAVAFIFTPVTNLLPYKWIVSTIVQFTSIIKGQSNIHSAIAV